MDKALVAKVSRRELIQFISVNSQNIHVVVANIVGLQYFTLLSTILLDASFKIGTTLKHVVALI